MTGYLVYCEGQRNPPQSGEVHVQDRTVHARAQQLIKPQRAMVLSFKSTDRSRSTTSDTAVPAQVVQAARRAKRLSAWQASFTAR